MTTSTSGFYEAISHNALTQNVRVYGLGDKISILGRGNILHFSSASHQERRLWRVIETDVKTRDPDCWSVHDREKRLKPIGYFVFIYVYTLYCNIHALQSRLLLWIATVWFKLIFQRISELRNSEANIRWRMHAKTNIKHCKMTYRIELYIGLGKTESDVACNSTLDR